MPKTLGGEPVKYIILDDESKPDNAAKNARRFASADKVDAMMGSNGVPSAVAMVQVAAESKTPMIALTPVPPLAGDRSHWTFVVPQTTELMMSAVVDLMKARGVKTVGYIGFSDTWGDLVYNALQNACALRRLQDRHQRALRPRRHQRHRTGAQNHSGEAGRGGRRRLGFTRRHAAHRAGGTRLQGPDLPQPWHGQSAVHPDREKSVEGAIAPTGALIVAEELPANFPTKAVSLDFVKRYESAFGAGSRNAFAGYSYDAVLLLNAAVPVALKKAKPGTPQFREALRSALENVKNVIGTHGVYNMSPSNHNGLDERARVLVHVENGQWRLMK